ncbi:replication initiator [Streptomyces sp. NRRL S-448]
MPLGPSHSQGRASAQRARSGPKAGAPRGAERRREARPAERSAAGCLVSVPGAAEEPARTFRWGAQLDVRPIKAFGDGSDITEQGIASYVAKYATKAAENTGPLDRRIGNREALVLLDVPDHTARLIGACLDLDPLYPDRRLTAWSHMFGFRGRFSTKSRQPRTDYRAAQERGARDLDDVEPDTVLVLASWQYAGHGHSPGESALAATIARGIQLNRQTAREALPDQLALEGAAS